MFFDFSISAGKVVKNRFQKVIRLLLSVPDSCYPYPTPVIRTRLLLSVPDSSYPYPTPLIRTRLLLYGPKKSGHLNLALKVHFHENQIKRANPSKFNVKGTLHLNLVLKGHFHKNHT